MKRILCHLSIISSSTSRQVIRKSSISPYEALRLHENDQNFKISSLDAVKDLLIKTKAAKDIELVFRSMTIQLHYHHIIRPRKSSVPS